MLTTEEQEGGRIREVNVTPLIDVSLVLVVMLMLTTPLAFEQSITVHRAVEAGREADQAEPVERVELRVLSEGEVRVNQSTIERELLSSTLTPLFAQTVPPQVVISCADEVPHGVFIAVLDETKVCGASEIAVTGE